MTLEQDANKAFDEYCQEKTIAYLLRWYQAEYPLSEYLQKNLPFEVDISIDGYSRFFEQKARQARFDRTGLNHTEKLMTLQLVA